MVNVFDGGLGLVWLSFLFTAPLAALGNFMIFRRRMATGVSSQLAGSSSLAVH
jgi:hypothetical protein